MLIVLRKWALRIALIAGVGVAISGALELSFFPHYIQVCKENPKSHKEECASDHITLFSFRVVFEFLDAHNGTITALATIVMAVFTGFLWYSTKRLWGTTSEAVKLAREEFISTHRPRIRVKHLWLQNDIWQGEKILLRFVIVNHGDTDATIAEINVATVIVKDENDLPSVPTFDPLRTFQPSKTVLPSGITYEFQNITDERVLSSIDNEAIRDGKAKLFCYGYVDYLDDGGRLRKTVFCRLLKITHPRTYQLNARFIEYKDADYAYED